MKTQKIISLAFLHAIAATLYIGIVVWVMNSASNWFGSDKPPFTGMAALMLLVLSVGVMILLGFVRPVLWYLDGKKKEAVQFLFWMIGFFFALTVIVFGSLAAL